MTDAQLIEYSLEMAAKRIEELAPLVYSRFFSTYPYVRELFGCDEGDELKGRVLRCASVALLP